MNYSCGDFLSNYPKDQVYPSCLEDFNELLAGEGYAKINADELGIWFFLMDDDVFYEAESSPVLNVNSYYWDIEDSYRVNCWRNFYKHISVTNVVLDGIEKFKDSGKELYHRIQGEAYFLRGAYYYYLVNLYAKPYSKASASRDLGVPLKLDPVVNGREYSRNSVEEVYQSIVADLTRAVGYLKGIEKRSPYRASEMGARLLLSRVLLYMERWEDAFCQCDTIIRSVSDGLLDYTAFTSTDVNVLSAKSVETLFSSGQNHYRSYYWSGGWLNEDHFRVSDELLALYDESDLRLFYFYHDKKVPLKVWQVSADDYISDYFILRTPEAYLNAAEAAIMLGKEHEAVKLVQKLRSKRIKPEFLKDITLQGRDLLDFIRDERRREYAFEGQRWFDLRRYSVASRWASQREIRHAYYNTKGQRLGDVVLKKYEEDFPYYVLLIPEDEILLNNGALIQNDLRDKKEPIMM